MARERPEVEEEKMDGAPEWMVTFSDCMTLLLTFFVLLLSFCGFGDNVLGRLSSSFGKALPSIWPAKNIRQESMWENKNLKNLDKVDQGTETKTVASKSSTNFMREKKPLDFRNLKVFSVRSDTFFWGNGSAISDAGREILDAFAEFLRSAPSRVVISENGPGGNRQIGLSRAWSVLEYMAKKDGIKKGMFSITTCDMMLHSNEQERHLNITLLDRSVYE
ncbi:MAG: flagellar motor protein MotB [Planctomycetota bacterium]|jgi:chemotaxis protein MotB